jgi:hypothetical protein
MFLLIVNLNEDADWIAAQARHFPVGVDAGYGLCPARFVFTHFPF